MQVVVDELLTNYEHMVGHARKGLPVTANADAVDVDRKHTPRRPVLLVLHGWGDSSKSWLGFGRHFSEAYEVIIIDLPGFGHTDRPPQPWGLDDYVQFVGRFLQKIDARTTVIVGHSNGGAIAVRGLAQGVLQADKLVLLASAGVRSQYKGRKKAFRLVAKTGKLLAQPLPGRIKTRLRRSLYTSIGSDMLVAEHLQETFKRVVGDDVQTDAAQLRQPALLLYGEDDVSTPPAWGRLLHERMANSTLEILGTAGHFIYQDQPEKVTALIEDFLR